MKRLKGITPTTADLVHSYFSVPEQNCLWLASANDNGVAIEI